MTKRTPFLTAQWRYLAMANYAIDPEALQPLVPKGVVLDDFQGVTYASMVGFMFLDARVLGCTPPLHRNFEEVNLRFYVRREMDDEVRRGVVFVKEIVPRWMIATIARLAYNENYVSLPMRRQVAGFAEGESPQAGYDWRFRGDWNRLSLKAVGAARKLTPGSLEEFITEHYWGYCRQRDGGTVEYQVEHPSWNVWDASLESFDCDIEPFYGAEFREPLSREPASAFIADGSKVAVYKPTRIA